MKKRTVKKYKLKKGVKVLLLIFGILLLACYSYKTTQRAVKECIENGNSQAFCTYQLGR